MTRRLRVGLLFGGTSLEHEVSVVSARGVARAMDPGRFECVPLAVTPGGRWLSTTLSAEILSGEAPRAEPLDGKDDAARIVADPGGGGLLSLAPGRQPEPVLLDVVFSVVHGWGGEDGRIQGLLDLAGLPCVGAGILGSAMGMDKEVAKRAFEAAGLPLGPWCSLTHAEHVLDPEGVASRIQAEMGFPLFVKPANGGSSVGISKVKGIDGWTQAIERTFVCDRKIVVERAIDAREIEVAVLGNDRPDASVAGEILPSREFYDYDAKYRDGTSRLVIPAPLTPTQAKEARDLALAAFRALDLAGLARVDFFVERGSGRVLLNEVNTLPGFTPISMYPKLWEFSGLPYADLLGRLVDLALERFGQYGAGGVCMTG